MMPRFADYPCLLPLGFHPMGMEELRQLCVTKFPHSISRPMIMDNLCCFVDKLVAAEVPGQLWIDGSFLTEKIDPKDVDIVLVIHADVYNSGGLGLREAVNWVTANQKESIKCDSYTLMEYRDDDPLYNDWKWWYSYWHAKWGFNREGDPKGIVTFSLLGNGT